MMIQVAAGLALAAALPAANYSTHGDGRLADLVGEALGQSPRVLRAFARLEAARHRIPQAVGLPDPTLSAIQFARPIETRVGPQRRTLSLSQPIPGVGKRAARGQLAAKAAEVSDESYRLERADTVLRVKFAYFELGYLDAALALSRDEEALLGHFEEIARRHYAQGSGLQADTLRLQARLTRVLQARHGLETQRVDLEVALNVLRAAGPDDPIPPVHLPPLPWLDLREARLMAVGQRARPEIRSALRRIEESEKRAHLARIRHRPDFNVGLTWGNVRARGPLADALPVPGHGKDSYGISAGMTLPLFRGKYDAAIREAAELLAAARFTYRDHAAEMEAEVRSASYRIQAIRRQLDLIERALAPQAEQALRSMEAAYSTGTIEVTGLLDAHDTLREVQLSLSRLRADYLVAVAQLERSVGAAIPEGGQP